MNDSITLRRDLSDREWDEALTRLRGHPLQSSVWGNARRDIDGIQDERIALAIGSELVWLGRLEFRKVPLVGGVAWMPRGPTYRQIDCHRTALRQLPKILGNRALVIVTDVWQNADVEESASVSSKPPRTIWVDLRPSEELILAAMHPKFRWAIRRAEKADVRFKEATDAGEVAEFFALCDQVSRAKNFTLPGSLPLMLKLAEPQIGRDVEARLFTARHAGQFVSGRFVMRCGKSVHSIWSAASRDASSLRSAEALYWHVIKWAKGNGCELLDVEGVDAENNAGTHHFKSKLGGREIVLQGKRIQPLGLRGQVIKPLVARFV